MSVRAIITLRVQCGEQSYNPRERVLTFHDVESLPTLVAEVAARTGAAGATALLRLDTHAYSWVTVTTLEELRTDRSGTAPMVMLGRELEPTRPQVAPSRTHAHVKRDPMLEPPPRTNVPAGCFEILRAYYDIVDLGGRTDEQIHRTLEIYATSESMWQGLLDKLERRWGQDVMEVWRQCQTTSVSSSSISTTGAPAPAPAAGMMSMSAAGRPPPPMIRGGGAGGAAAAAAAARAFKDYVSGEEPLVRDALREGGLPEGVTFELLPPSSVAAAGGGIIPGLDRRVRTVELVSVDVRALGKARRHLHETIQRLRAQQQAAERQRSAAERRRSAVAPAPAPAVRAREVLSVLRSDEALLDVVVGGVTHENLPEGVILSKRVDYLADLDGNMLRVELSGTDASAVANVRSMIEGVLT
jgi:hypothetical protein